MVDGRMAAGAGALGLPGALGLIGLMEAGIPIPIPIDLVVLGLGDRVAAGALSPVAAVVGLQLVAVAGTAALYALARGPAQGLLARFGPRVGLTPARLGRASALVERRGGGALLAGRTTPGLRTVTAVAAGVSGARPARALPWLVAGSTLFLQSHLLVGFLVGPALRAAIQGATVPALLGLAVLVVGGVLLWIARRGRRAGAAAWTEAGCPACLAVGLLLPERTAAAPTPVRT